MNLCPQCSSALKTSKNGWVYCPNRYNETRPCSFKGFPANGGGWSKKPAATGAIKPLAKPSDEQTRVLDYVANIDNNVIILAGAGTGKTTILVQTARVLAEAGRSVLALAFARRDKADLEARCGGMAKVLTSNGAGYSILASYCRGFKKRLECSDSIPGNILDNRLREDGVIKQDGKSDLKPGSFRAILALADLARSALPLRSPQRPTEADLDELIGRFDVEINPQDVEIVRHYALVLWNEMASLKNLLVWGTDFTGQVFLPVYHDLKPEKLYDVVLVDECQDQNSYNRALALAFVKPSGHVVAVGDSNQAIYSWRGADSDAVEAMAAAMLERSGQAPERFPLTLCRRCSRSVIRLAQGLVPALQPLPDAPEGSITELADEEQLFAELVRERRGYVLSRVNAPLISLCLKLLGTGVRAALARSNITGQLLQLIDRLSEGNDRMEAPDLLRSAEAWQGEQLAKLARRKDGEKKAQIVQDKYACLVALAEADDVKSAGDLKRKIDMLFPAAKEISPNEAVLLSTVHGAKGGEAKRVYLLSPKTKNGISVFDQVWSDAADRDNTLYVAVTRAEVDLVIVGPKPTFSRINGNAVSEDYKRI